MSGQMFLCPSRDDPDGMNNSRDVSEDGQKDIDPELHAKSDREENPHGREQNRDDDPQNVQYVSSRGRRRALPISSSDW